MGNVLSIFDKWGEKLVLSAVLAYFSPFKLSILVLLVLIITDALCEVFYKIKLRRISMYGLKEFPKKLFIYFAAIATVRLVEIGIDPIVESSILTHVITGFLIITESFDVLKKLTLLGLPLPAGFTRIIIRYFKSPTLEELFSPDLNIQDYIEEIKDMINYQIPNIKSDKLQHLLRIKFEEWAHAMIKINLLLDENDSEINDLVYYKLTSLVNTTREIVNERWKDEELPDCCIFQFNEWHKTRKEGIDNKLKEICYSQNPTANKKKLILERILTSLYQTIVDIQREETDLIKKGCPIEYK